MKRVLILSCITAAGLSAVPVASAHQVKPPGLGGACTTTLHAGIGTAGVSHTFAMPIADANSPAITTGRCAG